MDKTFGSLLPLLARIGHMATRSCKAVWESEDLTFPTSFLGGSVGQRREESLLGSNLQNLPYFLSPIYLLSI